MLSLTKREKLTKKDIFKYTTENSQLKSYILKELKLLIRNPVFLINCVLINAVWPILFLFVLGLLANIISSGLGILIDINRPKLNWDDEVKVTKQNFNIFINLIISLVLSALSMMLSVIFRPSIIAVTIFIIVISLSIIALIYYYISTKGQELYSRIEL